MDNSNAFQHYHHTKRAFEETTLKLKGGTIQDMNDEFLSRQAEQTQ